MDNIVTFINNVGSTCKGSVGTLLTLNYVVGEAVVGLSKEIGHTVINLLIGIAQAIHVLLEELGTILILRKHLYSKVQYLIWLLPNIS